MIDLGKLKSTVQYSDCTKATLEELQDQSAIAYAATPNL